MDDPFGSAIDPAWFVRPDGRDSSRSIHGVGHTRRVRTHAREIATEVGLVRWELIALDLAALWHDIGRTDDGVDYYHGAKSAGKVVGLGLHDGVEPIVLETALFAVTHHCGDEAHAERAAHRMSDPDASWRVFRILKDADALDRVRLGDLDASFLRYDASKARVARAWKMLLERA
ncbi:MAG: HD domain-containing protein [Coriobacteriia bacterium]|nr:HD domain-containing protein [Coriobacteriia bacterium]